jgi:hypothetical protein
MSTAKKSYQLTPAQIALSEARKAKKQKKVAAQTIGDEDVKSLSTEGSTSPILPRPWLEITPPSTLKSFKRPLRILTWNVSFVHIEFLATSD